MINRHNIKLVVFLLFSILNYNNLHAADIECTQFQDIKVKIPYSFMEKEGSSNFITLQKCTNGDIERWRMKREEYENIALWDKIKNKISKTPDGTKILREKKVNPSQFPFARSYAVLLGVSDYSKTSFFGDLSFAKRDVDLMKIALLHGTGFDEVFVLPENISSDKLFSTMKSINEELNQADRLLFFYSGHGDDLGEEVGTMALSQADDKGAGAYSVSITDIVRLSYKAKCRHALFIFDSCSSGLTHSLRFRSNYSNDSLDLATALSATGSRVVITAGTNDQETYEAPFDIEGKIGGHGFFTLAFVESLYKELKNSEEGFATIGQVFSRTHRRVVGFTSISQKNLKPLTPDLKRAKTSEYQGTFVFIDPNATKANRLTRAILSGGIILSKGNRLIGAESAIRLRSAGRKLFSQKRRDEALSFVFRAGVLDPESKIIDSEIAKIKQNFGKTYVFKNVSDFSVHPSKKRLVLLRVSAQQTPPDR